MQHEQKHVRDNEKIMTRIDSELRADPQFAAILLLYNRLAFGSLFAISSGHERSAEFRAMAKSGFGKRW